MPPRGSNPGSGPNSSFSHLESGGNDDENSQRWVSVSWMPHASLSQTSHVALSIRSVVLRIDESSLITSNSKQQLKFSPLFEDWQVEVSVYGVAGRLVPVKSATPFAPLLKRKTEHLDWMPSITNATHSCQWNHILNIPLRWRDLPRDAFLKFQVKESGDKMLYETTLPFFDAFGKLKTGMARIPLCENRIASDSAPSHYTGNAKQKVLEEHDCTLKAEKGKNLGLVPPAGRTSSLSWQPHESDTVWKASKIMEQLDRFEEIYVSKGGTESNVMKHDIPLKLRKSHLGDTASEARSTSFFHMARARRDKYGNIPSVPWLDKMAKEYCENVLNEAEEYAEQSQHLIVGQYAIDCEDDNNGLDMLRDNSNHILSAFLIVEFPTFEVPVMHEETFYPIPQQGSSGTVTPLDLALYRQKLANVNSPSSTAVASLPFHPLDAIPFLDYEDENDSPIDDKYRTLAHDLLRGLVDPALKPDRVQRDRLAAIIASPSHHPSREEKDLLWRFRFSLVDNRRALTKFLLAVDWSVESEVVQAAELLEQWRKRSPIEVTDALKLLGKQVAYQTSLVRAYAIDTLASAPDEELSLYLLQLVQALKFENIQEAGVGSQSGPNALTKKSSLAFFLIGRASRNVQLANYLYWYLKVELQDPAHGARYREIFAELQQKLSQTPFPAHGQVSFSDDHFRKDMQSESSYAERKTSTVPQIDAKESHGITPFNKIVESVSKFGDKLLGSDVSSHDAPEELLRQASLAERTRSVWDVLSDQDLFISGIMDVQMSYSNKAKQAAKEAHLRSVLAKDGYDRAKCSFPLPCAPEIMVNGVTPEKAKVFRSAVYPALIEFNVEYAVNKNDFGQRFDKERSGAGPVPAGKVSPPSAESNDSQKYRVLMKTGDDLRQDQLAMMMIKLMDGLLKRASLDLCVTPYSIIATSPTSGIVEFVEQSMPLSQILAKHNNSILQFFQSAAPQKGAKYGVRPEVISTYVRSVAGESVITYLLGVGDRHLDNLMITRRGNFFHIDFGFMFGRDPKPLPPAFRLTREMVEGMGGMDSIEFRQCCSLACQAFNALRKSAGLVLNLLHLMSDAGIEDLSNNPSADAEGVIAKVEERFRLDLTDEQAERFFLSLINDSLAAIAPRLMDVFHSIAVARR